MKFLRGMTQESWIITGLLALMLVLCLPGIGYGLPFTLVDDEPPFTLAALTMLQTKTLIPALNPAAFASVLYYSPYLSYIYLVPFVGVVGILRLSWHGDPSLFAAYVTTHLSAFFVVARCISVLFAAASVFLVYKIAKNLFDSMVAASAAAFLLATSISYMAVAVVARHWVPSTFFVLLTFYILSRKDLGEVRKYFWAMIIIAVGSGISTEVLLTVVPVLLWYLTQGTLPLKSLLGQKRLYLGFAFFVALTLLPSFLYPRGNGFLADVSIFHQKTLLGFLASPVQFLSYIKYSEPILLLFAAIGAVALWVANRRLCVFFVSWICAYAVTFYAVFFLAPRYITPLLLLLALLGGYGVDYLVTKSRWRNIGVAISLALLAVVLIVAMRFSYLISQGDTRVAARTWITGHATSTDKVLVYTELTRFPTTASAVEELRAIDRGAVRRTDEYESKLNTAAVPALNLYNIKNDAFFAQLPAYAKQHGYTYAVLEPSFIAAQVPQRVAGFAALSANATVVATLEGLDDMSIQRSAQTGSFLELFSGKSLGPTVVIYKLKQ